MSSTRLALLSSSNRLWSTAARMAHSRRANLGVCAQQGLGGYLGWVERCNTGVLGKEGLVRFSVEGRTVGYLQEG